MHNKRLTSQLLNSNLPAGKYYDQSGTGLFFKVSKAGSKAWSQRIRFNGKQLELGLGIYPNISLTEARKRAADNKSLTAQGINPKNVRAKPVAVPTFAEVANEYIPIKQQSISSQKHSEQWRSTIEAYVFPAIGEMPVNEISVNDIHKLLSPIWSTKIDTASRLRGRIEDVLDYAIVKQLRDPPNPAMWKGNLSALLPSKSKAESNRSHPALAIRDAQRWWADLKRQTDMGAIALRMLMLCASRSGEVRGMLWDEIELFSPDRVANSGYYGVWICPAARMKARRSHEVPITAPMLDLLLHNGKHEGPILVFPSSKDTPLADTTLAAVMKRLHKSDAIGFYDPHSKRAAVPHGLRSTFRDWAAENAHSREAAELQLAHQIGSMTEHAYYRTNLLSKRADLLKSWFAFLEAD